MRLAEQRLRILLVFLVVVFAVWAKVDYAVTGYAGHYLSGEVLSNFWLWMWIMGVPTISFVFALAYWTGAPKTKRNQKIAVALFLTGIFLAIGQLQDFFYFALNGLPFPSGEWTWFRDTLWYEIFGAWTTPLHFLWLGCWITIVLVMWKIVL
jgi:hypothetical protein